MNVFHNIQPRNKFTGLLYNLTLLFPIPVGSIIQQFKSLNTTGPTSRLANSVNYKFTILNSPE